jgi:hypothetical protein
MKLLGRDISPDELLSWVGERLKARGLAMAEPLPADGEPGVEPRVDPLSFNVEALDRHADSTRALPLETHRGGVTGRAVLLAKRAFRASCQIFINEALGRQTVFNAHVRDSYAQLSAEVLRLRERVAELETATKAEAPAAKAEAPAAPPRKTAAKRPKPKPKKS